MEDEKEKAKQSVSSEQKQFLSFLIEGQEYCVDVNEIMEVRGWTDTTDLPESPKYMKGVINLRGKVIPIIDLRMKILSKSTNTTAKHVTIILSIKDGEVENNIGILVDAVSDILSIKANEIKNTDNVELNMSCACIDGLIPVDERMVVIINVKMLLGQDMEEINQSVQENENKG